MFCRCCSRKLFIAATLLLVAPGTLAAQAAPAAGQELDSLVSTEWLSRHLADPDQVLLDCSVRLTMKEGGGFQPLSGQPDYEEGHIPGATFADLTGDLCDVDSPLQYALPTPAEFCAAMGALGVGDDSRVVLYDRLNSVWAARVWWMLRWVGFDRAALLDGGYGAWTAEDRPLSTEPTEPQAKQLTLHLRPALMADRDEVLAALGDDAVSLIDVMPEAHYRGQMALYDRPGHIPGAINIPTLGLLEEPGRFRSPEELATICAGDRKARFIVYCGGGIAASANAFVMVRLGFTDVAVYAASLQEWAADPELPLETE